MAPKRNQKIQRPTRTLSTMTRLFTMPKPVWLRTPNRHPVRISCRLKRIMNLTIREANNSPKKHQAARSPKPSTTTNSKPPQCERYSRTHNDQKHHHKRNGPHSQEHLPPINHGL